MIGAFIVMTTWTALFLLIPLIGAPLIITMTGAIIGTGLYPLYAGYNVLQQSLTKTKNIDTQQQQQQQQQQKQQQPPATGTGTGTAAATVTEAKKAN
jgi:uncharacterized membrane protein